MFINIHTHAEIFDAKVELVSLHVEETTKPSLYSYGIHPWKVNSQSDFLLDELERVSRNRRCMAVGECGLDKTIDVDFDLQEKIFIEQVRLANEIEKPLMIHCVKAFNELITILKKERNHVPVIIHGFNNNLNIAESLLKEDYYLSFGKALLTEQSNASEVIKHVGRKRLFLETDDTKVSIKYIYKKASELLGIDETILQEQLRNNYQNVFKEEIM